jgi:hypothetical protein
MNRSLEFNASNSIPTTAFGFNAESAPQRVQTKWRAMTRSLLPGVMVAVLLSTAAFSAPATASAAEIAIGISLHVGPPPIPVYTQPPCPAPGYMWTPGYWAFDPDQGYYWVPGTWVAVPEPGMYWTPGYWGWGGDVFVFHAGYWGPHIGFYGGINYGFGYTGVGFVGGEWRGGSFFYNRSVTNLTEVHVTNVYYRNVPNAFAENRASYNGGAGGIVARPNSQEMIAERDHHVAAIPAQRQNQEAAHQDRSQFAAANHGMPGVAATRNPGELHGAGAVPPAGRGGAYSPGANPGTAQHNTSFSGYHNTNPGAGSGAAGVHQPAGVAANPGGNHETTSDRPSGFSGYHNPNAGGGTYKPQSSVSQNPGSVSPERGSEPGQYRGSQQPTRNTPENEPASRSSYSSPGQGGSKSGQPPSHNTTTHNAPAHNPPAGGGGQKEPKSDKHH